MSHIRNVFVPTPEPDWTPRISARRRWRPVVIFGSIFLVIVGAILAANYFATAPSAPKKLTASEELADIHGEKVKADA